MNVREWAQALRNASTYADFNARERRKWVERVAASLPPGTTILDVGAGECQYRPLFAHCVYKAHDFCQYEGVSEGVQQQSWNYGLIDYESDITEIPVPDASFDAILCTEVLEHVPEPIRALAELARTLKPGGQLFISAPLGSGLHQVPFHFYGGYTPYFYRKFLTELGFENLEIVPNGGFFKHFAQESHRVATILKARRRLHRFSPLRVMLSVFFARLMPVYFYHLDDDIRVDEFAVGFFVSAQKVYGEHQ